MSCPFLKEGRARYCHAAPIRKLILEGPGVASEGRCATPEFRACELVRNQDFLPPSCPHLEEIHVQYCAASPVIKLVPFSESQLSRCTGGYRYCDSYLALSRPSGARTPVAPNLLYSSNHFWVAVEESNLCHVGIDGFLAELMGRIDGITFITTRGTHRPSVALTVNGLEWPMVFPNPLLIERVNSHLRTDVGRVTADPYGVGWLFEGWELPGKTRTGLVGGAQAAAWQAEERERLARHIHETQRLTCGGGFAQPGVARLLPREDVVGLFQRFFSRTDWSRED
jgi:glycine cleavage system H lipoate-binding protein